MNRFALSQFQRRHNASITVTGFLIFAGAALLVARSRTIPAETPASAHHRVGFSRDIKPIFEASCIKCHGRGRDKGGFRLDTRETLLSGGDSGPAVVPGDSAKSYLIDLVAGTDPDNIMPQKGTKLTSEQVELLRAWIDEGLPWEPEVNFGRKEPINLFPRRPELPPLAEYSRSSNPIDRILSPYFATNGIVPNQQVDDRLFARRVFLDVIGVPPPPLEIEAFVADNHPKKRELLVDRLLADDRRYAEHWLTFWNDLLRNDYRGTGYIDGGRKQITRWLYSALATNMPYDQFVANLVNPTPETEGFTKGIVWRGVVNASQTPQMQAAQNISQVFMGINLKCASCHDSFIDDWTLADSYGLASIYANEPLEMVTCDKPTGQFAAMRFLYPELGTISSDAPKRERLKQLAKLITQRQNGRLPRTIVNRLWERFFGRGLVEPIDDMETPAWNTDLLDWLAEDLVEEGYDLKKIMRRMLKSKAYQMPARIRLRHRDEPFVFQGPEVRRLSAEQFRDALAAVTGAGFSLPIAAVDFALDNKLESEERQPSELTFAPKWIWNSADAANSAQTETLYLRKRAVLEATPTTASVVVTCDNSFTLFVNGNEVGSGKEFAKPKVFDLRPHLRKGTNIIAVTAVNESPSKSDKSNDPSNPAGFFLFAKVRHESSIPVGSTTASKNTSLTDSRHSASVPIPVETVMDFGSDATWIGSSTPSEGWQDPDFLPTGWQHAFELGDFKALPWDLEKRLGESLMISEMYGSIRASLVTADPLTTALGRPNREQLITRRSSEATTLQALELTNGETLTELLNQGAENLLREFASSPDALIQQLYMRALSRPPNRRERKLAKQLVGAPARGEGVEDLIWAVTMLPEFQLIY